MYRQFSTGTDWHLKREFFGAIVEHAEPDQPPLLSSEAYRITLDDGRESFFALSIEEENSETAWLMSDTVYSLDSMR